MFLLRLATRTSGRIPDRMQRPSTPKGPKRLRAASEAIAGHPKEAVPCSANEKYEPRRIIRIFEELQD